MPYDAYLRQYQQALEVLTARSKRISLSRLLVAVLFLMLSYFWIKTDLAMLLPTMAILAILFVFLVKKYKVVSWKEQLTAALVKVNEQEIAYVTNQSIPFDNGANLMPEGHAYAYDLDCFGVNSLFQHLNRTGTELGKIQLGQSLLTLLPDAQIVENQAAVQELTPNVEWRQRIQALASIQKDKPDAVAQLQRWSAQTAEPLPVLVRWAAWILPALMALSLIGGIVSNNTSFFNIASGIFTVHLLVLGLYMKRIRAEIARFDQIHQYLLQYGYILQDIEKQSFTSKRLIDLQKRLTDSRVAASTGLNQLSSLFSGLDSISNLMAVLFFDGFFLYHIHTLRALLDWKSKYAQYIPDWLNAMGEVEMLSSLANFAANNPDFAYPELNQKHEMIWENLGHPLIRAEKRICNDVDFSQQPFIVLTGSNMSGKSTFLRSLGVNMVLAGMGAPVCASRATVHPTPVWVSMRLSDSLADSESYFFAEVKRLKTIMDELEAGRVFVLLDEILRGTNSDDKRLGTVGVLQQMVAKKAIGAVATHDIEVCNTTFEYSNYLANHCFEVEMINDELSFDYRLREGVCKNKSATFLMRKMGIIKDS